MDYIKLSRKILEWEWYGDINTCRLFIHMLLKANWKDGRFQGMDVPRGSFVSSISKLSLETSMTVREVRTALSHLEVTGEVTHKGHAKYSVFTVKNYGLYQSSDIQNDTQRDKQATSERHSNDIQTTTIEEKKESKKGRTDNTYTGAFEEFWQVYPRKKDKGNAFKKFNARLNSGFSEVELIKAAKEYARECQNNRTEERYIKHATTFLSDSMPFLDYLKREEEPVSEQSGSSVKLW